MRVVLVTGANRGIGRELARQLARRGDTVVLTARDLAKAERTAAALPGHERVLARRLDVTDPASIQQLAADLVLAGELRRDRILVNAVCPGWVATDMGGPGGRPVTAGAASIMYAVDLP
ncbi:MAG TPA: SDR family NAD(P)-dependent oxidoreductase, partial [Actinomycetes bacterium]|nr:SDR family NAD(P)-dependent oxidoreductase [Actinomycetes bacterium]